MAETGLPALLPPAREDATTKLRQATSATSVQGPSAYWSLKRIEDVGWSYVEPLESMLAARGTVCFDASKVEVRELALD